MVPDPTNTTTAEPKGLASMFGHKIPQKYLSATTTAETNNNEEESQGGGSWKSTTKQRKERKSLASYARLGKKVTITASPIKSHIDDDNDIAMGGLGKKKKAKRFSPYGGSGRKKTNTPVKPTGPVEEPVHVLIQGVQPGSEEALIQYLQLKSKKEWQPLECKMANTEMLLTVNGHMIAMSIIRLDGYMFGTEQLHIQLYNDTTTTSTGSSFTPDTKEDGNKKLTTMDLLRTFLKSRWNGQHQFLNLEAMHEDPFLKKNGIKPPGVKGAPSVVGPAMMKLANEMFQQEGIITLSLANNRLHNVQPISTITQYLPNLQNLSLQNNLIKSFDGLEAISGTGKLTQLKELILSGNPLQEHELKQRGDHRGYVRHIVKRFPSLTLLDGQPILLTQEEAQSIQKTGKVLPLDTKANFFDQEDSHVKIMAFLNGYFTTFDQSSQRGSLATMIYDPQATFSVATLLKLRAQVKLKRREKKKLMVDDDAIEWTSIHRNLKLNNQKQSSKGFAIGTEAIGEMLQRLPPTKHDFTNTKEFVMDAYQTPIGYYTLVLHGEFKDQENDDALPYSFDRTFILKPSLPGSLAANAGSPFIIQADNLIVRDYIGHQGFQPHQNQHIQSIFTTMPSLSTVAI